jgi:hypothetical protein
MFIRRVDEQEFHWLSGILEGEGTFGAAPPSTPGIPFIRVVMTDRDVVDRVAKLWARALIALPARKERYKTPYATVLKGSSAVGLMTTLRPYMGRVRQEQIDRAVRSFHGRAPGRRSRSPVNEFAHPRCNAECALPWLAGLLEGEGSFCSARVGPHAYPVLEVKMCDDDVVERARVLLGATSVTIDKARRTHWNQTYRAKLSGHRAAAWMRRLSGLMSVRRQAAIDKALAEFRPIQLEHAPKHCVGPGCDKTHRGRGLCHKHYMSWSRDVARGRTPRVTPLR